MAEDDEIDIVGDFSFNSCFAQNSQGIPSCSDREDTVHPQWLLDSTAANWYDSERDHNIILTTWTPEEKELFVKEIAKCGRNIRKISQKIKTKTEAEVQALIEAEYGVHLDNPIFGLVNHVDHEDVPTVAQEEIVEGSPNINNDSTITHTSLATTGSPTMPTKTGRRKTKNQSQKHLLKPLAFNLDHINPSEIMYEDDLVIGSTESIGSELDLIDKMSVNLAKQHKEKVKAVKKVGNHRRKISRNFDKGKPRNKSKELKSPQSRQRKESSLSEDSTKSPQMALVFSSGQALPVSEGEQVIKIEKKKDSDPESDIDIDVDSDNEEKRSCRELEAKPAAAVKGEPPIAIPLRKFEPMPRRRKKINLDGGGGCTIMHTESGDLYEMSAEPRKERLPRKQPIYLIRCHYFSTHHPAPFSVRLHVSTLLHMECHASTSRAEVMGLVGGQVTGGEGGECVTVTAYRPVRAQASGTHCEMDPVSAAAAGARLAGGARGWHHSHPAHAAAPSRTDLRSQAALQAALAPAPCLAFITSQQDHHTYTCFQVERTDGSEELVGYQFKIQLVNDLTPDNLPDFTNELRDVLRDDVEKNDYTVDLATEVCPQAKVTYLEKCISICKNHLRSAGYATDDPVLVLLEQGIKDIFR